ncbi:MAG: FAD-dependent oxidoreductase [Bacteroidetes bacterium]|nr:FAD-dependent oxidoreductase [Bacteroidota bacterium]
MNTKKKILVLGAGISGLTAAYLLKKEGFSVTVLEKKENAGGSIETIIESGFLFDIVGRYAFRNVLTSSFSLFVAEYFIKISLFRMG